MATEWMATLNEYTTCVHPLSPAGTVTALPSSTLNQVGQAFSLLLADAIARGSVDTAADLFYQSMLRTDTLQTSVIVVNSMVEVSGCEAPLTFALKGEYVLMQGVEDDVVVLE